MATHVVNTLVFSSVQYEFAAIRPSVCPSVGPACKAVALCPVVMSSYYNTVKPSILRPLSDLLKVGLNIWVVSYSGSNIG